MEAQFTKTKSVKIMELGIYGEIIFWVFSISIFMYELFQMLKGKSSNSWISHPAKVTDVKIESRIDEGTEESKPYIIYYYHYMGSCFRGNKVKYGDLWSTNYGSASKMLLGITKGSEITIYVNPKNPSQSVLYRGYQGNGYWFLGFFAIFFFVAYSSG